MQLLAQLLHDTGHPARRPLAGPEGLLAANSGRVVTRDEILDVVWGLDFVAESNIVDRHIRVLRSKLQNDYRQPRYIAAVPGRGYRFVPTVEPTETRR
jgi:DNA-binding response OmpR family regulator